MESAGIAAGIHLTEKELPAEDTSVRSAFGFKDAAHAPGLIIMRRNQAVASRRIEQLSHSR